MRNRFNAKENPLVFNFNYKLTLEEEKDLYFIANLSFRPLQSGIFFYRY